MKRQTVECVVITEDITARVIITTGESHGRYYIIEIIIRDISPCNDYCQQSTQHLYRVYQNNHQIFCAQIERTKLSETVYSTIHDF